jgi:hypothetical protein
VKSKDAIIRSEELNELCQAPELADASLDWVEGLLEPCVSFIDDQNGDLVSGATDAIIFLTASGVDLPSIVELEVDGAYTVIWSLMSAKRIKVVLTKAIEEAKHDDAEQEKQDAEIEETHLAEQAVATLEKELAEAKRTLAAIKTSKGSKSK